ncbi:14666_t:CDS:2, partial [Cetraspora pellucida]
MAEIMSKSSKQTKDETKKFTISNFKFSPRWLHCFLKRHDLSLRHKTKIAQKLLRDLEDQLLSFQQFVIHLRQKNEYPLIIIFKEKVWPINTPSPPAGVAVWFQDKAMLVLDSFSKHITDWVKAEFHSGNTDLAVISGGLTRSEDHLIYDDCKNDKDDESDEDAAGSDEDEEYDEQPDEGEEPDE